MASRPPAATYEASFLGLDFLNQVSCFETLRAYQGRLFKLSAHLIRLEDSCRALGYSNCFSKEEMAAWLQSAITESGFPDGMLRVSLHWGGAEPVAVILLRPFTAYPEEIYEKGVGLKTAVSRRWTLRAQDPQIKASQYVPGVLAELDRTDADGDLRELIFLDATGFVAEGTVSNIFIVKQKRVLTPSGASGILRGISRELVLELARKRGLETLETCLTRHEIYSADECFMTNTSSEVLPVVRVDGRIISDGKPGPVSKILRSDFHGEISK